MCTCIIGGIALGLTSIVDYRILWLIGALGAQLRLTANMLDGMVAIASSRTSKTGELYNEVPDRISDACGPMAKQHRMLVITLICVYATITPRSWQMIQFHDSQIGLMTLGLVVIVVGCVITVIRRVGRIADALK